MTRVDTVFRRALVASDLAAQASSGKRTPDHGSDLLIERERHQLPFVLSREQRVVRLMRHVARPTMRVGNRQRLHQMPAGEVRASDMGHLAGAHQIVHRVQPFVDRRQGVERVQLPEIDRVRPQAMKARLARGDEISRLLRRPAMALPRIA